MSYDAIISCGYSPGYADSKDIMVTRNIFVQKLQIDFTRSKIIKTRNSQKIKIFSNLFSKFSYLEMRMSKRRLACNFGRYAVIIAVFYDLRVVRP